MDKGGSHCHCKSKAFPGILKGTKEWHPEQEMHIFQLKKHPVYHVAMIHVIKLVSSCHGSSLH